MALVTGARTIDLPGGVHAAWSDASLGDLRPTGSGEGDSVPLTRLAGELAAASGSAVTQVTWVTQVHGSGVVNVEVPAGSSQGTPTSVVNLGEADALVCDRSGIALCVLTADCGALALSSREGVFGAVHAGWRGLTAGVIESAVARMRQMGATEVVGSLGPCIHGECYEFSPGELGEVAEAYGAGVRARTSDGRPALDLSAGIGAALANAGATAVPGVDSCTACGDGYFSHRARRDSGRQALLVWAGQRSRST